VLCAILPLVCSFQSFKMAQTLTLALGFLSAAQALPSWKEAVIKRGAADVLQEYDYVVGKYFASTDRMDADGTQSVAVQLEPQ
jgi:hypothetical protein